ncbi:MAG: hypothetical protein P1V21_10080 [Rhizobiaceae bacterium]|nr:hypothetical protein [Rhizobiaceae bacterium]
MRGLKGEGQSILVVDRTLSKLFKVADRGSSRERRQSVWDGTPDNLSNDIRDRYLDV